MISRFLNYIKSQGFDTVALIGLVFAAGVLYWQIQSNSSDIKSVETRLTTEMKAIENRLTIEMNAVENRITTEMTAIENRLAARIDAGFKRSEDKQEEIDNRSITHETRLSRIEGELANISKK